MTIITSRIRIFILFQGYCYKSWKSSKRTKGKKTNTPSARIKSRWEDRIILIHWTQNALVNVRLVRGENEANFFMLKRRTRHLTHPLGKGHRDFSHFKRCKNTAILIAISTDNNSPIICSLLALLIHRGFIFLSTIVPGTIGIQELKISIVMRKPTQKAATGNRKQPHHLRVLLWSKSYSKQNKTFKPKNLKSTWKCTRNCPPVKSLREIQ